MTLLVQFRMSQGLEEADSNSKGGTNGLKRRGVEDCKNCDNYNGFISENWKI